MKPQIIIYTDGASRGNPGQAASAYIIKDLKTGLEIKGAKYLGVATNNEAEYNAVKLALEKILEPFVKSLPVNIEICSDSMLIVEQLSGKWKIKNNNLRIIYQKIKFLENSAGQVCYKYIPREENSVADFLANQELDKH